MTIHNNLKVICKTGNKQHVINPGALIQLSNDNPLISKTYSSLKKCVSYVINYFTKQISILVFQSLLCFPAVPPPLTNT